MSLQDYGPPAIGRTPLLTIVVPAHQAAATIGRVLAALEASDVPRRLWELIVVDDASTDDTALIAARFADAVIRLPDAPRGPAYARNRGGELARAPFVAFIDADVVVRPETLRRLLDPLDRDSRVGIASAVCDGRNADIGFLARYCNLSRQEEQGRHPTQPEALWSGCCVVRRSLLPMVGNFDEWHFAGPQGEMRELGRRVVEARFTIHAIPDAVALHLKRYRTLAGLLGDVWRRRVTHVRLAPDRARLGWSEASAIMTVTALALAVLVQDRYWMLAAAVAAAVTMLLDLPLLFFLLRQASVGFAVAATPLHGIVVATRSIAHLVGTLVHHTVGAPRPDPTHEAYSEIGLDGWPPPPHRPRAAQPVATTADVR